jgi:amidohydrolase
MDLTTGPIVVTIGTIEGGARYNIVPEEVRMTGTLRSFDPAMRRELHRRVEQTATRIAESAGAVAEVRMTDGTPVTWNDPALTSAVIPSLQRVASGGFDPNVAPTTTAEDFSRYQEKVPGVFFFLGVNPPGVDRAAVAPNHSPRFFVDEAALVTGVRALASLGLPARFRAADCADRRHTALIAGREHSSRRKTVWSQARPRVLEPR